MPTEQPLSRRTLVRAAGWSVPVIAVAVATPAAAASVASEWTARDFAAIVPPPEAEQPDYIAIGATLIDGADPSRPVPDGTRADYLINGRSWTATLGYIIEGNRITGGGVRPDDAHLGESISIEATFMLPDGTTVFASGTATVVPS